MKYAALGLLLVGAVSACTHSDAVAHYSRTSCKLTADSVPIAAAFRAFIAHASPTPQRFLYVVGTDSTPPDPAVLVLQDKGPTYMYPASGDQQAAVKAKLASIGDYNSLLIGFHGFQRVDATHGVAKLSGVYVGAKSDGQTIPQRAVEVQCDSLGWHGMLPEPTAAVSTPPSGTK